MTVNFLEGLAMFRPGNTYKATIISLSLLLLPITLCAQSPELVQARARVKALNAQLEKLDETIAIDLAALPFLPGARYLAADGIIPGGTRSNLAYARRALTLEGDVSELDQLLAADAQTSGGLLIAVSPEKVDALVARLTEKGPPAAAVIGAITGEGQPGITLRGK